MTEQDLNRLLRRVDWRFLMSNPRPHVVLSLAGGRLHDALHLIAAQVTTTPAQDGCDVAVVDAPTPEKLRAAWGSLAAGGHLYAEWTQPTIGGMQAIERHLQRAGFANVQIHWAWPMAHKSAPLFWLPVHHPGAMAHFFAHRPASRTWGERFRRSVSQGIWRAGLKLGMTRPLSVIAQKVTQDAPATRTRHGEACLLLTGGQSSLNKVVGLKFNAGESTPHAAMKWARVPQAQQALEREAAMLQCLHALQPEGIAGVPRARLVRTAHAAGGSLAVEESVHEGQPLYLKLNAGNFRQLSLQAAEWLVRLVPDTPRRMISGGVIAHEIAAEFERRFGHVAPQLVQRQLGELLANMPAVPRAFEQRDFSPWNVMLDANHEFIVLDWESAVSDGLPALDLIYFLTHLAFFVDGAMAGGDRRASYRKLMSNKSDTGRIFAEAISHYAIRTRLDPAALRPLRLLAWMIHACSAHRRLGEQQGEPQAGKTNRADASTQLFLSLLEEELSLAVMTPLHSSASDGRTHAWAEEAPAR